jgi:hypothetical protein
VGGASQHWWTGTKDVEPKGVLQMRPTCENVEMGEHLEAQILCVGSSPSSKHDKAGLQASRDSFCLVVDNEPSLRHLFDPASHPQPNQAPDTLLILRQKKTACMRLTTPGATLGSSHREDPAQP